MGGLKKSKLSYVIIIILCQTFLLLFVTAWKQLDLFNISYDNILNIILFIAVGLSILSFIIIKELFVLIQEEVDYKVNQVRLEENQKKINKLRSQKHDFLNHLQTIHGMIELDKKKEVKEYIKSMRRDITDNKLQQEDKESCALESILSNKKEKAIRNGLNFSYQLEEGTAEINLPTNKLVSIISNLLDNAIDATRQFNAGSMIKFQGKQEGQNYIISVYNNGSFINRKLQAQIFEPGFSTKGTNRGFGLYIIKSIIEEFDGRIELKSEEGFGTEFICLFKTN